MVAGVFTTFSHAWPIGKLPIKSTLTPIFEQLFHGQRRRAERPRAVGESDKLCVTRLFIPACMQAKTIVPALLVLTALVGAIAWYRPATIVQAVTAPAAPAPHPPAEAGTATAAPAAPDVAPPVTLADRIDALIATRDPRKAYEAYHLLADCATFNQNGDRLIFEPEQAPHHLADGMLPGFRTMTEPEKRHDAVLCATMTERMRQSRLDYLAQAAQAGVPGAAMSALSEGPFGDRTALTTRPNDPLVQEWKARTQEQLVRMADEQGDVGVLSYLSAMHAAGGDIFDKDPGLAYRYGVATSLIMQELAGPDNELARLYRPDGGLMQNVADSMTPQERADQMVAARRIADAARARRKRESAAAGQP